MSSQVVKLDIAIIGAGIAGLATALAISKQNVGHRVTIYESQDPLSEFGAGVGLGANATRILYDFGLAEEFKKVVNQPDVSQWRRYDNNHIIGEMKHNPLSEWQYGFPQWQVYRPDLQNLLRMACEKEGVDIVLGKKAKSVDIDAGKILFEDGGQVEADFIVAADGLRGKMRHCIPENEGIHAKAYKEHCFRAVVTKEKMMTLPETAEIITTDSSWKTWCGPGLAMLGYPIAGGQLYNLVLTLPRPGDVDTVGKWSQTADPKEALKILEEASFCEQARKVWSLVEECNKWTLGDLPPLPTFVSANGRLALAGDCCHAIIPHAGQGAAGALEDAASLAVFIGSLKDKAHLPKYTRAWSEMRQARMTELRKMAANRQVLICMPDGPEQQNRDKAWAESTARWKKELAERGEEGIREIARRTKADPGEGDWRLPETRMYVLGYDAAAEARKVLAQL